MTVKELKPLEKAAINFEADRIINKLISDGALRTGDDNTAELEATRKSLASSSPEYIALLVEQYNDALTDRYAITARSGAGGHGRG